jgi:ferredoxin
MTVTDWPTLWEIARSQRIEHPAECKVLCGSCGVQLTNDGIIHWPDCDDPTRIMFMSQDLMTGQWEEIGQRETDTGPLAF